MYAQNAHQRIQTELDQSKLLSAYVNRDMTVSLGAESRVNLSRALFSVGAQGNLQNHIESKPTSSR